MTIALSDNLFLFYLACLHLFYDSGLWVSDQGKLGAAWGMMNLKIGFQNRIDEISVLYINIFHLQVLDATLYYIYSPNTLPQ